MSVKKNVVAAACGLALAASAFAPAVAMADQSTNVNPNKTDVVIKAEGGDLVNPEPSEPGGTVKPDQLIFTVPQKIEFGVDKAGKLIAPSQDSVKITNNSAFDIHVSAINLEMGNGWTLKNDAGADAQNNVLDLSLNGQELALQNNGDLSAMNLAMGFNGSNDNSKSLNFSGSVEKVTKDLSKGEAAATITWTIATGK